MMDEVDMMDEAGMIKVLVVEDSAVARSLLAHILSSGPGIRVIGTASNGEDAVLAVERDRPDIVTMDVHMPKMDGYEATRAIMETNPIPIVIVTGSSSMIEMENSFRAIEAGALAVIRKPQGPGHPDYASDVKELITMVKVMSEVRVVRRRPRHWRTEAAGVSALSRADVKVIAIGASTGGPPVIQRILSALPKDYYPPVLVVQHMSSGFIQGFTEWLSQTSRLPVHMAVNDSRILPGHVYVAPDGMQMKVNENGRLSCGPDGPNGPAGGHCPSVAALFRSVADVYGGNAAGVLLTGMGKDGAEELRLMKDKGALTIAQDEESSVVFGMPGEAVRLGAAMYVLPPEKIEAMLSGLGRAKAGGGAQASGYGGRNGLAFRSRPFRSLHGIKE